jgi:transposase
MSISVPLPSDLVCLNTQEQDPTVLFLQATTRRAACPFCGSISRRVHSRYWRTLRDLPCAEQRILLRVQVRRFLCSHHGCLRRTFAERFPGLAAVHAQRTDRLKKAQLKLAQALGSRSGVRLAEKIALPVSAATLLRMEHAAPVPEPATPRVLGVDDWAFKKGHRYGTILIDQEKHCIVDLLPDRTTDTLAAWLKEHPGVEIVTRDRADAYADGIHQGAPNAVQVADRWHLARNLGQALERLLDTRRSLLKQAVHSPAEPVETSTGTETQNIAPAVSPQQKHLEQEKFCRRQCRLERYQEVRALFSQGWNIRRITQYLGLSRKTVRKLAQAEFFPERKVRAPRPRRIDPFTTYLQQRWQQGCHNGALLFREIRAQGYTGSYTAVKDYLKTFKPASDVGAGLALPREKVAISQVVTWVLRREEDRTPKQRTLLARLCLVCEPFAEALRLAEQFLAFLRQSPRTDQAGSFRSWLHEATASHVAEVRSFAQGLARDQAAVEAGLSLSWSNGATEGHVNRLKCIKRRGYGRAGFDLLRRRVVQPT